MNMKRRVKKNPKCACYIHLRDREKDGPCLGHGKYCPCTKILEEQKPTEEVQSES